MSLEDKLADVFESVFGWDRDRFSTGATPQDVPNWDSMGHMNLVMKLEEQFGQRFDVDEITEMVSAERILEILRTKGVTG